MQALNLNNEKLAILAALLGNYLLPDEKLKDVYTTAGIAVLTEVQISVATSYRPLCVLNLFFNFLEYC